MHVLIFWAGAAIQLAQMGNVQSGDKDWDFDADSAGQFFQRTLENVTLKNNSNRKYYKMFSYLLNLVASGVKQSCRKWAK